MLVFISEIMFLVYKSRDQAINPILPVFICVFIYLLVNVHAGSVYVHVCFAPSTPTRTAVYYFENILSGMLNINCI